MAKMMAKILEKTIKNPLLWQKSCIMAKTYQHSMTNGKQFGRYLLYCTLPSVSMSSFLVVKIDVWRSSIRSLSIGSKLNLAGKK